MNETITETIWSKFFALRSANELKSLLPELDDAIPAHAALRYYINTWTDLSARDDDKPFNPAQYLSPDRSAAMYGLCPVIFEGTNEWAFKPYRSKTHFDEKFGGFTKRIAKLRETFPSQKISLLVVPEKDYLISTYLLQESRFREIRAALHDFGRTLNELSVEFIFDEPLSNIATLQNLQQFEYFDTHLLASHYVSLFKQMMMSFGIELALVEPAISLVKKDVYGDLAHKFDVSPSGPYQTTAPFVQHSTATLTAGSQTFEKPLGDTWQLFDNATPTLDQTICILGDSHSSIFDQRRLTYLAACTYRQCAFYWNPIGLRPDALENIDQDHILLEISQRFIL